MNHPTFSRPLRPVRRWICGGWIIASAIALAVGNGLLAADPTPPKPPAVPPNPPGLFALPQGVHPFKAAIYSGPGASQHDRDSVSERVRAIPGADLVVVPAAEFATRDLSKFNLLIFSGGSGSSQAKALGAEARSRVREFVKSGGGYLGICAGAYLACSGFDWSIGLLNARTVSPHWQRGQAMMRIQLTEDGKGLFGAVNEPFTIRYHNGPIIEPLGRADLPPYQVAALFRTELVGTKGAPAGVMLGSPAVAFAPFGQGKVMIISPHSEDTPGLENFIPRAIAWINAASGAH